MGKVALVHPAASVPQWYPPGADLDSMVPAGGRNLGKNMFSYKAIQLLN